MRSVEARAAKDWDVEGNGNPVHQHLCECCGVTFNCDCGFDRAAYTVAGCIDCAGCDESAECTKDKR
jgi:hypothetical protein